MLSSRPAGQRDVVGGLVLGSKRAEVLPRGLEVAIDEPVPVLARDAGLGDRRIALPVPGNAKVRQAAEVGVDVVRRDLDVVGRRPLGRDEAAPAIVGHIVAAGDVGILEHAAAANREGRADHLVDVERDALGAIGAERAVRVVEVAVTRLLGDDIDGAAGGAAAGIGGGRAAQNLDLLGEEVLADADGGVTDAVDEDVVARVETADEEAVAERVAALPGSQRHAGGGATDLAQRGDVLVLQHLLAQHGDCFRRVEQRLRKLAGRLHAIDLVGRGRIRIGITIRRQVPCIRRRHRRGRRGLRALRSPAQCRAGADLIRRRFSSSRTRASDRGIDRHRREIGLLGFGAGERSNGDQTCERRNRLAGIVFDGLIDRIERRLETQRPRCFCSVHYAPLNEFWSVRIFDARRSVPLGCYRAGKFGSMRLRQQSA